MISKREDPHSCGGCDWWKVAPRGFSFADSRYGVCWMTGATKAEHDVCPKWQERRADG